MTHTLQLIEKVEFLLQLIAGTEAAESQTVVDICDLIGKIKMDQALREMENKRINELFEVNLLKEEVFTLPKKYHERLSKIIETLLESTVTNHPLIELKNPKNPE